MRTSAFLLPAVLAALGCAGADVPSRPPLVPSATAAPAPPPARPLERFTPPPGAPRYGAEPRVAPTSLEARAAAAVAPRLGAAAPSGALALAARSLAQAAARGDESLARDRVRAALARGLSFDPAPAVHRVHSSRDGAAAALARALPPSRRATHYGVGAYEEGDSVWLVLLTSERKASLAPFPRDVPAGSTVVLSGRLERPLLHPRVYVSSPSGEVREVPVSGGAAFEAEIPFPEPGRWLVEVVAQSGPKGPEVAALLTVAAGGAALDGSVPTAARPPAEPDPADLAAAEARVVEAINAARRARWLRPVIPSGELAAVARAHSEQMRAHRTLAHVMPGSGDLGARLRRARVAYVRAYENVAMGATALAAHEAAEESPAHLGNILAPGATHVGVGAVRGTGPAGTPVIYLTEIFVERAPTAAERQTAAPPDTAVREVLWRERARAGAPPLIADARLDVLAREAAAAMRRADDPGEGDLARRALGLGRRISAVDVFVASGAEEAARSANVRDRRFRRVGVGVAVGDSARFGAGRLWIAVVFTD